MTIVADEFAKFAWTISTQDLENLRAQKQVRRIFIPPTIAAGMQLDLKWSADGKHLELVVYRLQMPPQQDHGRPGK